MPLRLRTYNYLIFFIAILCYSTTQAFAKAREKRVIIILDASTPMLTTWNGSMNKYDAASAFISKLQDSLYAIDEDVQFCLRLYGHLYPIDKQNCRDSRLEVYFSKDNRSQIKTRLSVMQPRGIASLGYALQQSVNYDIIDSTDYYTAILITAADRYCEGNICSIADALRNKISGNLTS